MKKNFTEEAYNDMIETLFRRFPSFQKVGASAYKPGVANMEFADQLMGHPHKKYKIIHVAGTNGKGSVSNMLASVLTEFGHKVGLYTSPHILDFRERMRIACSHAKSGEGSSLTHLVQKEYIWDFIHKWQDTFDHLNMSFFEITTLLALNWFADEGVDVVVLETGLGGRLDSTNIVNPILSVITNIGLDHCDMLGETLPEIAFEKAGIIKPRVPVVVGESHPETDEVFERKVLYTNIPEPEYMGSRTQIMSLLRFADKTDPSLWDEHEEILQKMDLQGEYQSKNLRTVLAALEVLGITSTMCDVKEAIVGAASRMDFHGRWEKIQDKPYMICDIGHNEHGLKYNFAQLDKMMESGKFSRLFLVYGSVADKDVDAALRLLPKDAVCIFTQADSKRALASEVIKEKYMAHLAGNCGVPGQLYVTTSVPEAMKLVLDITSDEHDPLVYVGGSTYVVSEAVSFVQSL